jgi:dTDP-4-amino-4,6-dideoxyglucose
MPSSSRRGDAPRRAAKGGVDDLAIFGGAPLFSSPRPIGQLDAPDVEQYLALLRESYDARHLANDGPLLVRLEARVARLHGVKHCIALANAGLGLTMLMQLFARGRPGEVIMPAFSYRGLPHFCRWAGQAPRFCDVDARTHFIDARSAEGAVSSATTAILAVCNFNDPGDIEGICAVGRRHGVPVILDSVYAVGASYGGRMLGSFGRAEVYSFHATKLLNGFEGGYVTTDDEELARMLRWQRNFCLPGLKPAGAPDYLLGLNAKLNELHAALALISVERIDEVIARNRARYDAYRDGLAKIPGVSLLPYAEGERANYQMAVIEIRPGWPLTRDQTVMLLRAEGAAISAYYSPPLHRSEHSGGGETPPLPVAEELGRRFVQLPVGELVSLEDVADLCRLLAFVAERGDAVARRAAQGAPA